MYVNTLISLQENASTYAIDQKNLTGHVTITSPGRIMCYVQNLNHESADVEYGLYLFCNNKSKGVRVGKLKNDRETKWLVKEADICDSKIKLDEIDGAAVVAEKLSRGTELVLSGFTGNRYMIIPIIDQIYKPVKPKAVSLKSEHAFSGTVVSKPEPSKRNAEKIVLPDKVNTVNITQPLSTPSKQENDSVIIPEREKIEGKSEEQTATKEKQESERETLINKNNTVDKTQMEGDTFENSAVNKIKILAEEFNVVLSAEDLDEINDILIKILEKSPEAEKEPAIQKVKKSGIPYSSSSIPDASVVRENDTLNRILSTLKEDDAVKAKAKSIEEQLVKMSSLSSDGRNMTKSDVERKTESSYISRQNEKETNKHCEIDSSPRNAHAFLAMEHEMPEEDEADSDFTDYLEEINNKIKEIENKREKEAQDNNINM